MIDMQMTPQQAPSTMAGHGGEPNEGPKYPYGLEIRLEGETLKRLAIGEGNLPAVGTKLMVKAMGEVISVSKSDNQIEDGFCVCIQLQALELMPPHEPNEQQRAAQKIAGMYEHTNG